MNDISTILKTLDSLNTPDTITEAPTPPSTFVPTHFHKSNLFGAKTKLMWHNGKYWVMRAPQGTDGSPSPKKEIQQWFPGPGGYSRNAMNPGSIDGEYVDGKAKEWPEGYEHEQWLADKTAGKATGVDGPADAAAGAAPEEKTDGKLKMSDGRTFYRDQTSQVELNKHAARLVKRLDELVKKMNESIPNSLKGYLSESDRGPLLLEALNDVEAAELQRIYKDLEAIANFTDDQGPLISDKNVSLLKQRLARAKPAIDAARPGPNTINAPTTEPKSDGEEVTKGTSGSLEAFAKSGKGGLANDRDEVEAIKELQQYLQDLGFDPNGVDGKYGPGTKNAVKEFQAFTGAKTDGDAGPETIGKIIKLRSIKWGKGGSKSFADLRKALTRAEELIAKKGKAAPKAEGLDFRGLINLVEFTLNEALSDEEAKELDALIAELSELSNDAEWMQVLPPETTKRISDIAAQGRTTGSDKTDDKPLDDKPADDKDEPADDNEQVNLDTASAVEKAKALHEGLDGLGTDEEAVLAVLGSIADFKEWNTVKSAFLQLYKQDLQDWLDSDTSFGDQANITAIINRLEKKEADGALTVDEISTSQEAAQGLYDAMKGGTGIGTDEETLLAILGKISTRQFDEVVKAYNKISKGAHVLAHVADELSGTDWDRANGIVKRFGYELLKDDPGFKKLSDASGDPADTGSTGADAGADATPAADKPMTAAELDAIDVNTPEGADKFLKGLISNPELFGQLDAETQQAIKDAVGV
jgi:peptidoglycan hydrolase-like protein with peptidoglycan-binding domain